MPKEVVIKLKLLFPSYVIIRKIYVHHSQYKNAKKFNVYLA